MTKKGLLILSVAASAIMLVAASAIIISKKNKSATGSIDMLPVAVRPLKMAGGWGYEVLVDNKIYIHQDCIPAISSYKRFQTEAEAMQIGNQVIDKIKHGKKPIVTVKELDSTHIHY